MNPTSPDLTEVLTIPRWVKGMLAGALIIFLIQIPQFNRSLTDARLKHRASLLEQTGQFPDAIKLYTELLSRYPDDKDLIKLLAFAQYHAGEYVAALTTLKPLAEVEMPKAEVEEINKMVDDIVQKLKN